jgi:hypothetical protein
MQSFAQFAKLTTSICAGIIWRSAIIALGVGAMKINPLGWELKSFYRNGWQVNGLYYAVTHEFIEAAEERDRDKGQKQGNSHLSHK